MKVHRTYAATDRPEVEVLVDGTWHFGDLRQWLRADDGNWHGDVRWSGPDGNRIGLFPADRIRRNETDWTPRGRAPAADEGFGAAGD